MPEPIQIGQSVHIPAKAISIKAVRSSGPGGQNVNKVSSKIELRIDLDCIQGLSLEVFDRLRYLIRNRMDANGYWTITSSKTRDQLKNIDDARLKVVETISEAMDIPAIRQATRPTKGSRVRRMEDKRRVGEKKRGRGGNFE